ncbi:DUF3108 domain-containing protein [Piscinibacter terrae]|uniref:DUF3108 domain-containing protein n=1 Tax=Piscinibacter terrae TaxID=2496871 RepID=A0A3N7HHR7_9BURK|nr:DUF3108 domain-containing protein [Albitalea terrae]RQP21590.1 DUF3108 domain-containing protein [Albitalea terrae]
MAHGLSFWRALAGAGEPWPRRLTALSLVAAVVVIHGCIADHMGERMLDLTVYADMPERVEAVFVREMEPTAPPAPAAVMPPVLKNAAKPRRASAPAKAASQPVPEPEPEKVAMAEPEPVPVEPALPASAPEPAASEPAAAASAALPVAGAGSAPAFEWPASTRVSYVLSGNYQGEIHGTAQVEWIRLGNRYQVHLDVTVGLPILPLMSRKMTSDGVLTPEGLVPQTYDEDSKVAGRDRQRRTIRFEPDAVVLNDGSRRERWPGVQDAASQFVQLTFLFTNKPALLAPGQTVEVPLALPRNIDRWIYDVLETEVLYTPFGAVEGVHLKPRRVARKGGDLVAEIWVAPTLAYLPARIRIAQDENTFIDLMIKRRPQLASQ